MAIWEIESSSNIVILRFDWLVFILVLDRKKIHVFVCERKKNYVCACKCVSVLSVYKYV